MSDQPQEPLGQEPMSEDSPTSPQDEPQVFDAEYVKGLRAENAKYRIKAREKEEALAQLEAERKAQEQAQLEEDQRWKELADKRQQELEQLQAKIQEQEIQSLKMATINELGLPAEAMVFLTGDDAETIKAQAEKFQSLTQARSQTNPRKATTPIPGGSPVEETIQQKRARLYGRNIFDD